MLKGNIIVVTADQLTNKKQFEIELVQKKLQAGVLFELNKETGIYVTILDGDNVKQIYYPQEPPGFNVLKDYPGGTLLEPKGKTINVLDVLSAESPSKILFTFVEKGEDGKYYVNLDVNGRQLRLVLAEDNKWNRVN